MVNAMSLPGWAMPLEGERRVTEPPSDVALARAAAAGDRQAFARLVDLSKRPVFGLCLRLLQDQEEARDAAQESFVRAWSALASFDARQPFAPWLLRIARNHCIDLIRRRLPQARKLELDAEREDGERTDLPDGAAPRADEQLEQAQVARTLDDAVGRLPERYREVIHLFHVEQLSYKEIASTLEVPIGTVMTWLHRARAQLRQDLSQREGA
jgi:RNA polymerase sigma-70 factor (ECF subfamily)